MAKKKTTRRAASAPTLDASSRIAVIHGPEQMLKQEAYQGLRDALAAEHGDVEPAMFDGERADLSEVLDELRTLSMFQSYKLVVVDTADEFVKRFREPMERYAKDPVDHATLVLRASKWNRGNLDKAIAKVGAIVKCEPLKSPDAAKWLIGRAKSTHSRPIDRDAADLLVARLGTHLMKLDSELAKLALMVDEGQTIDTQLVADATGRASDEAAWLVQGALLDALAADLGPGQDPARRAGPMIAKVRELIDVAGHDPVPITWAVIDLCRKLTLGWAMKRQGAKDFEIGKALRLFPRDRQTAFTQAMRRIDASAAGRLFDQIIARDARTKRGVGQAARHLECFCLELAEAAG